jgi:hypothetical protein
MTQALTGGDADVRARGRLRSRLAETEVRRSLNDRAGWLWWRAGGPYHRRGRRRTGERRFVGRAGELAHLDAALRAALEGRSGAARIAGEAGVGKSRLLGELYHLADAAGARVVEGTCLPFGEAAPYVPIVSILRSLARVVPAEALPAVLGPGRADLARLVPEFVDREPYRRAQPEDPTRARLFRPSRAPSIAADRAAGRGHRGRPRAGRSAATSPTLIRGLRTSGCCSRSPCGPTNSRGMTTADVGRQSSACPASSGSRWARSAHDVAALIGDIGSEPAPSSPSGWATARAAIVH